MKRLLKCAYWNVGAAYILRVTGKGGCAWKLTEKGGRGAFPWGGM